MEHVRIASLRRRRLVDPLKKVLEFLVPDRKVRHVFLLLPPVGEASQMPKPLYATARSYTRNSGVASEGLYAPKCLELDFSH